MGGLGTLYVVSSPSGGGKGSILSQVLARDSKLAYSVSATTRQPREGEVDGTDYFFVDDETFKEWRDAGRFAEWAEVHDNLYGTPRDAIENELAAGKDVVFELDVQGMQNMKKLYPAAATIFIMPPSLDELERRLRNRGGLEDEELALRLANAEEEMKLRHDFDHVIMNDNLDCAVADFESIVAKRRAAA